MKISPTALQDVLLIEPSLFGDKRGYFMETYRQDLLDAAVGRHVNFVQDNESMSSRGVLRGLHFQRGEASQAKLVRVSQGRVVDVAVDLRRSSPSFAEYVAVELSADNHRQLFIPRGFAHGFIVLSDVAVFQYKVDNAYCPQAETTLRFDDESVAVNWPHPGCPLVLSPKDMDGLSLDDLARKDFLF